VEFPSEALLDALASLKDDCADEGLDCRSCVEVASRNLAVACAVLQGKSLELVFTRLYRKRGCRKMFREFETLYHGHVEASFLEAEPPRMPSRAAGTRVARGAVARCA
jgi:hypothetical protein